MVEAPRVIPNTMLRMSGILFAEPPAVQEAFYPVYQRFQEASAQVQAVISQRNVQQHEYKNTIRGADAEVERTKIEHVVSHTSLRELWGHPDYHGIFKRFGRQTTPSLLPLAEAESQAAQARAVTLVDFTPELVQAQDEVSQVQQDAITFIESVVAGQETLGLAQSYVRAYPHRQNPVADKIVQRQVQQDENYLAGFREYFLGHHRIRPEAIDAAARKYGMWVHGGRPTREEFMALPKSNQNGWRSEKRREILVELETPQR